MFANFGKYMRFIARRERIASALWLVGILGFVFFLAALYPGLFPTKEALESMAATLDTPGMIAMMGPVYGRGSITPAIAMSQECLMWVAMGAIIMNILFVNRHTRVDEELGRHEMLASLPVGHLSGSLATIKSAFILNAAISLLGAFGIMIINIEGSTAAGAFAYSLSVGAQGMVFASITLLAAQLFSTARGSLGVSFALLGLSYVLRAMGDMSGNVLSFISPMGLGLKIEAFYTNDFTPIIVLFIESIIIAGVALAINTRRDVGAGVFAARKGRAEASKTLLSPFGFAWRLSRANFIAWSIAFFIIAAMYGTVVGELDTFVKGNDMIRQMIEAQGGTGSLAESFLPLLCTIMALLSTIPVVGTINRIRVEERRGRMEQIYACSVSRISIYVSFVAIAVVESFVFMLLSGIGLYATAQGTGLLPFGMIMNAAFVYVPAILLFAGIMALLVGVLPRMTSLTWVLFVYSFLTMYFGRLFDMPEWATRISPFGNIPSIPVQEFKVLPLVVLCVVAEVLSDIGYFAGYRKRDVKL